MNDDSDFKKVQDAMSVVPGFYALVEWMHQTPNQLWMTGPYETEERANVDLSYFIHSDTYGEVRRCGVAGGAK